MERSVVKKKNKSEMILHKFNIETHKIEIKTEFPYSECESLVDEVLKEGNGNFIYSWV